MFNASGLLSSTKSVHITFIVVSTNISREKYIVVSWHLIKKSVQISQDYVASIVQVLRFTQEVGGSYYNLTAPKEFDNSSIPSSNYRYMYTFHITHYIVSVTFKLCLVCCIAPERGGE